ncbi:MAG: hypothetical protein ACPGQM_09120 [Alphaproteobacteria bacterium]
MLGSVLFGKGLDHMRADGLGKLLECRIGAIDQNTAIASRGTQRRRISFCMARWNIQPMAPWVLAPA